MIIKSFSYSWFGINLFHSLTYSIKQCNIYILLLENESKRILYIGFILEIDRDPACLSEATWLEANFTDLIQILESYSVMSSNNRIILLVDAESSSNLFV